MTQTVFDPLRKKHVALTPEEGVRQFFIKWLVENRNYPASLMASEYRIEFNKRSYRCDIVAFNKQLQPILIVECKAPNVEINNTVLDQIVRYNYILKVKTLIITNGNTTFALCFNNHTKKYEFVEDVPYYTSL